MSKTPYSQLDTNHLTLRDHLALDRTTLANERTFLAYIRTALALFVIGVTFLHFLADGIYSVAAYAFMGLGILVFLVGTIQFLRVKRRLDDVQAMAEEQKP
jgi:putative membrane protein